MSAMIDRVAIAVCPWAGKKSSFCPNCKVCVATAYAAIKAMRQQEMIDAAACAADTGGEA